MQSGQVGSEKGLQSWVPGRALREFRDAISVGSLWKKKEVMPMLPIQVVRKARGQFSSASLRPEETSGYLGLKVEIYWRKWI